jgi:hypothetical protein
MNRLVISLVLCLIAFPAASDDPKVVMPSWSPLFVGAAAASNGREVCRKYAPKFNAEIDAAFNESIFALIDHERLLPFLAPKSMSIEQARGYLLKGRQMLFDNAEKMSPEQHEAICKDMAKNILKTSDDFRAKAL